MASDLPPGWKLAHSKKNGRPFYYNPKFKISVWEHPQYFERQEIDRKIKNTIVLRNENYNFCLDTNVLIHHLAFVDWVLDLCNDLKRSYVNVPYKVWEELDNVHKYAHEEETRELARKAMKRVEKWMSLKDSKLFMESKSDFDKQRLNVLLKSRKIKFHQREAPQSPRLNKRLTKPSKRKSDEKDLSNDEKILNFCKVKLVSTRRKPFFITNDRNLRVRVIADGIKCCKPEFEDMLEAIAIKTDREPATAEGASRELPSSTSTISESLSDDAMEVTEYQPPDPRTALPREILERCWNEGKKILILILVEELKNYFSLEFPGRSDHQLVEIMKEKLGPQTFYLLLGEHIRMIGILKFWSDYDEVLQIGKDNWTVKQYQENAIDLWNFVQQTASVEDELDLDDQSWIENLCGIAEVFKHHQAVDNFLKKIDAQFS